jgi:hypothetical protein
MIDIILSAYIIPNLSVRRDQLIREMRNFKIFRYCDRFLLKCVKNVQLKFEAFLK